MLSGKTIRVFLSIAVMTALLTQILHVVHHQVVCHDQEGTRLECADLLGRCHCHDHDLPQALPGPGESRDIAKSGLSNDHNLLPCKDIPIPSPWRKNSFSISASMADTVRISLPGSPAEPRPQYSYISLKETSPPSSGRLLPALLSTWRC